MLAVLSKVAVDARNLFPEYAGHPNDDVSVSVIVDVRCFQGWDAWRLQSCRDC